MNDQGNLLASLNLLRQLLDLPTTLSAKHQSACRAIARDIADRCYFNLGWHAAQPDRDLQGVSGTTKIFSDMAPLLDLLQARSKSQRGKGRPTKDTISGPDIAVVVTHLQDRTGKSLASIINEGIKTGWALDKNKTTESHVKRIERIIEKLRRIHAPKTNNVLEF